MKVFIKDFFSKYDQSVSKGLITFTKETINGKLHFCTVLKGQGARAGLRSEL